MGKNLYERRKARVMQKPPTATKRQVEVVLMQRACEFAREYMATEGWSRKCERKAILLNMAAEHYEARHWLPLEEEQMTTHGIHE